MGDIPRFHAGLQEPAGKNNNNKAFTFDWDALEDDAEADLELTDRTGFYGNQKYILFNHLIPEGPIVAKSKQCIGSM